MVERLHISIINCPELQIMRQMHRKKKIQLNITVKTPLSVPDIYKLYFNFVQ